MRFSGRRVVVTGLGLVTPVGVGTQETWRALLAGRSGVGPISRFDTTDWPVTIAGEVRGFDPGAWLSRKDVRKMDRFIQYAVGASRMAMAHAGLGETVPDPDRAGVLVGVGLGGLETIEAAVRTVHERGPRKVSPFTLPKLLANMAPGQLSILLDARGPCLSSVSACATGAHSVGDAARLIAMGDADLMVAGGCEATITPLGIAGFAAMRALSRRNDEPQRASRPFDADRDGFVCAEGAGVLILELLEHAQARGARILCELAGYGQSSDAYHMTQPDPEGRGAKACMRTALADAGLTPDQVQYVNAHGTSTPWNDRTESQAIRAVFGPHADSLAVSSTKSMTGHMLGAAGAVEAAVCALALSEQVVPPTINLTRPGEGCDLDYVTEGARRLPVEAALSNSFGFGGTNVSLVFRRLEGAP